MSAQSLVAKQSASYPASGLGRLVVIENTVDFLTDFVDSLGTAFLTAADSVKLIKIPKGLLALQCLIRLERKGTIGANTFTLGDSVASDSWMDTANLIGTTGTNGTVFQALKDDNNGPDNMLGYFYTADDYVLLTEATSNCDAKLTVALIGIQVFSKITG